MFARRAPACFASLVVIAFFCSDAGTTTFPPAIIDSPSDVPLVEACRLGDVTLATQLIEQGADVNALDREGIFPLMQAACRGNLELIGLLLRNGADVNQVSEFNHDPAVYCSKTEEVAFTLLASGVDLHRRPGSKDIAIADFLFVKAAANGWVGLLETVHGEIEDPAWSLGTGLRAAARAGRLATLKKLLAWGAPLENTDDRGITALMAASFDGQTSTVRALLIAGADPNTTTPSGETALSSALWCCLGPCLVGTQENPGERESVVRLLVGSKARITDSILERLGAGQTHLIPSCQSCYDFLVLEHARQSPVKEPEE